MSIPKSGFILLWKPQGWTSFDCIRKLKGQIKTLLNNPYIKNLKIGHTGVLDPMAEGILLIGYGQATKFFQFIPDKKTYFADGMLGKKSNTFDKEGEIVDTVTPEKWPSEDEAQKILTDNFLGKIMQTPPVFSNIKVDGKKARDLARLGQEVEMKERPRTIYSISLLDWSPPKFKILVECESGTYIRSIVNDFGIKLGSNAYCESITRTSIESFSEKNNKIARFNLDKSEFDIEENIISLDDFFKLSIFSPLVLNEFYGDELLLKSTTKVTSSENTGIYPIYKDNQFIGFALYNNESKTLISKRLIDTN